MNGYESPINYITTTVASRMAEETDKLVLKTVREVGVNVNKEELIKALKYDRGQYEKGYADGQRDAVRHGHWIKDTEENSVGCSVCHSWQVFDSLGYVEDYDPIADCEMYYCSYCGAKMDEEVSE